jgi:transcriptional regulator with XRE-family HTH domain
MEVIMIDLSEKIKIARRVRGLTQEEAAEELGFSSRSLMRWEHGGGLHPVHRKLVSEAVDRWLREAAGIEPER